MTIEQQDNPASPTSSPQGSPGRRRILSRSLSRGNTPPSLTLTTSNGSTAAIPYSPPPPVPSSAYQPSLVDSEDKELPPPPPEKSVRRKSVKSATASATSIPTSTPAQPPAKDLSRSDSLLTPSESKSMGQESSQPVDAPEAPEGQSVVKRKAVGAPVLKKFKSLAELSNGPRGGKGGPMPPTSAPRKGSVDANATSRKGSVDENAVGAKQPNGSVETIRPAVNSRIAPEQTRKEPVRNVLPPTPDEDKALPEPAVPRKVFAGLPSNPRAKGPGSPLHQRGKSSTGFNPLLKVNLYLPYPSPVLVR